LEGKPLAPHLLDSVVHQEPEKNLAVIKRASLIVWENINFRGTYARAKGMAKEQVYQDWQKTARNVGKAADVLQLFLDETVAPGAASQRYKSKRSRC